MSALQASDWSGSDNTGFSLDNMSLGFRELSWCLYVQH